jgi:hypothetical protein
VAEFIVWEEGLARQRLVGYQACSAQCHASDDLKLQLLPWPVDAAQRPRLGCAARARWSAVSSPVTVFTTCAAAASSMSTSKLKKLFLGMPSPPSKAPWQPINMTGEPPGPLVLESLFSQGQAKDARVVGSSFFFF